MESADYGFTCVTCQLQFKSAALQREHFTKSDLHRYNAKRKVADLPPVSADVFNEKIAERRQQIADASGTQTRKRACKACAKTFSSENAYQDHLNSKRHREKVLEGVKNMKVETLMGENTAGVTTDSATDSAAASSNSPQDDSAAVEEDAPAASTSKATAPELTEKSCLFCPRSFSTLETNLKHMANNHAFYIPDLQYCVDIPGLLKQLGQDIALGNICIFCGHGFGGSVTGSESNVELVKRAQRGLEAVRKHMVDKGHCRIPWDTDNERLELSDFYDFTSSYDQTDGQAANGEMEVDVQDAAEWEDEDGSDIDETDEVYHDYSAIRKKIRRSDEDALRARMFAGESDYELVLPSGARIGHRALKDVYKANVMRTFFNFAFGTP